MSINPIISGSGAHTSLTSLRANARADTAPTPGDKATLRSVVGDVKTLAKAVDSFGKNAATSDVINIRATLKSFKHDLEALHSTAAKSADQSNGGQKTLQRAAHAVRQLVSKLTEMLAANNPSADVTDIASPQADVVPQPAAEVADAKPAFARGVDLTA